MLRHELIRVVSSHTNKNKQVNALPLIG